MFTFHPDVIKNLPAWTKLSKDHVGEILEVDSTFIYPKFLAIMGAPITPDKASSAEVEVARLLMTRLLKRRLVKKHAGEDGKMRIRITTDKARTWKLTHCKGTGRPLNHPVHIYNQLNAGGKFDDLIKPAKAPSITSGKGKDKQHKCQNF